MRSNFFIEIAESRERFYSQLLGNRIDKREIDQFESGLVEDDHEYCPKLDESVVDARRKLLLDFMGKLKFWIGF